MSTQQDEKSSEKPHVEKLPEPARSLAKNVRKDVADAKDGDGDRPSTEGQTAEQMEEWIATRGGGAAHGDPSTRKP